MLMLEWYKKQKFYGLISINLLLDVPINKRLTKDYSLQFYVF